MSGVLLASIGGAVLFFAAGAATMMLRRTLVVPALPEVATPVPVATELIAVVPTSERGDVDRLRRELADAHRRERAAVEDAAIAKAELGRLHVALDTAERTCRNAKSDLDVARAATVAARTELARSRTESQPATSDDPLSRALRDEQRRVAQLETQLDDAKNTVAGLQVQRAELEAKARDLVAAYGRLEVRVAEVEHDAARDVAIGNQRNEKQVTEATQDMAGRVRDLASENEQLKGRLGDAEALRADYVRLRTAVSETAYLKAEIRRLEEQVRTVRRESLGGLGRRPPRASSRLLPAGSIAASLAGALERFAEPATRSSAIADPQGFPLATAGEDGQALAAYAALAIEVGDRAAQLLPVGRPSVIEIIDERGARLAMWSFEIEHERLVLANLSVAPVESARVESTLADLTTILATGPRA